MKYRSLVILTGAGISADSGLSTFRDPDGVWSKVDYRDVATPEGFARDPNKVHAFYNGRRASLSTVNPNRAHRALAALEAGLAEKGGRLTVVTQNVDDLHERAGSKALLPMHGELAKVRCEACGDIRRWSGSLSTQTRCGNCQQAGSMRPHVVWFGEMPLFLNEIEISIAQADLFISIGTSGSVYPAAGLVGQARALGVRAIELNLEPSDNADLFDEGRYGAARDIVPKWVSEVLRDG